MFRYLKKHGLQAFVLPLLVIIITVALLSPYISDYGNPDGQNWKHEANAMMLNSGMKFEFNHRYGYIFLLGIGQLITSNNPDLMHLSAMILNVTFFAGFILLVYLLGLLLFKEVLPALITSAAIAFVPGIQYECLSCEHRIVSIFFVGLIFLSLAAYSEKKQPLCAAVFFLALLTGVECRLDNMHYFASVFSFIFIFRKRFPLSFILLTILIFFTGAGIVLFSSGGKGTSANFFTLSNMVDNFPHYAKNFIHQPVIPAAAVAGVILGIRKYPEITIFLLIMFAETLLFWLVAATQTVGSEYIYQVLPLTLLASIPVAWFFSIIRDRKELHSQISASTVFFILLALLSQISKPSDRLAKFGILQGCDREIRSSLREYTDSASEVILRPEYTYVTSPGIRNIIPLTAEIGNNVSSFIKMRIQDLPEKAASARRRGIKRFVCFSLLSSETDCQFIEIWPEYKNSDGTPDFKNDIQDINLSAFETDGTLVEHKGQFVKTVELRMP